MEGLNARVISKVGRVNVEQTPLTRSQQLPAVYVQNDLLTELSKTNCERTTGQLTGQSGQ